MRRRWPCCISSERSACASRWTISAPVIPRWGYLQRFPFDKIKIDRCFIKDVAESDGSASIVQAVVNIAAARHMTTTAEGVETQAQLDMLRKLGCTEMQGYLFSPAKPAAEIVRLLRSRDGGEHGSGADGGAAPVVAAFRPYLVVAG
jgi:predicted signal transduction protein with EAL and GGDEF domain